MPLSRFLGTGLAVPDRVVTNDDLSQLMDTSDQWIRERTGIRERRWVREGETGSQLALTASTRAIEAAGIAPAEVEAIVYASSTPDHFAPGNGVYLQRELGAGPIPAIDIRTQCSGFVYALAVADGWIRTGLYRRVLGPSDDDARGILAFDLHSDGQYAEKLWVDCPGSMYHPRMSADQIESGRHFLEMDGREVFRHAVARMPESVRAALAKVGRSPADLRLLVAHQANLRIAEMMQRELELRDDQVYNNIQVYGNTTAATIPIALDECVRAGRVGPGDLVALTAFGSGFLWGSAVLSW
jgi:3-oxoacyl-[acyl-carrier-protein] synthase-3